MSEAHGGDAEPTTDEVHDNSWSVNLETPEHAGDREAIVGGAIEAIERTAPGNHVNLVTHGGAGHPREYLYPALDGEYGGEVEPEYVEQCGCGGHVTRVRV